MKDFIKRVRTALLLVLIVLIAIASNAYGFMAVFGIICGMSLWEFHSILYYDLTGKKRSRRIIANVILGMLPYFAVVAYFTGLPIISSGRYFALGILLFLSISVYYIVELASTLERPFTMISYALTGIFYVTVPCIMMVFIAHFDGYYNYMPVLGLILLNWINDTGAYVVGSQLGKHKLFERISPKKTWEGFFGGAFFTIAFSFVIARFFSVFTIHDWVILSIIVVIFGTLGDLIESMFKRSLKVKDTSSLLPGHGGFLDRFDSLLFMIPFAAFYILIIKS
jgi:phosphatidate cytidylyltransferase